MRFETVAPRFLAMVVLAFGLTLSSTALPGGTAFGEAAAQEAASEPVPPCCAQMGKDMPAACQKAMAERMAMQKKMHEKMVAEDAKLNDLVAKMNEADGAKKMDAMAAVLSELVQQHTSRHQKMMAMRSAMTQGCPMMEGGSMPGGGPMMEDCPMMKGQGKAMGGAASEQGNGSTEKPSASE